MSAATVTVLTVARPVNDRLGWSPCATKCWAPYTPLEETLSALDAVVRLGKVRYLGFSNWSAWKVSAALEMQKANGLAPFTHGQMHYSQLGRDVERDVIPMMRRHGLGMTVWSPLSSRSFSRFELLAGARRDTRDRLEDFFSVIDWVPMTEEVARRAGEYACLYRRSHSGIGVVDYLLAATVSAVKADLMTINIRHFPMFDDLRPPYDYGPPEQRRTSC